MTVFFALQLFDYYVGIRWKFVWYKFMLSTMSRKLFTVLRVFFRIYMYSTCSMYKCMWFLLTTYYFKLLTCHYSYSNYYPWFSIWLNVYFKIYYAQKFSNLKTYKNNLYIEHWINSVAKSIINYLFINCAHNFVLIFTKPAFYKFFKF